MAQAKSELLKLDVQIVAPIFVKDEFGIYTANLLNGSDFEKDIGVNAVAVDKIEEITITGQFGKRLFAEEEYIMYAERVKHQKYGMQYKVSLVNSKFDTPNRVRAFVLQYVAPAIADQLIDLYGGELIDKIVNNEVDYSKVHGMGDVRFKALQEKVMENLYMKDIVMELGSYGVTPRQMKNIVKIFGASSVEKINENPYVLCKVSGIGFLKADDIAKQMGFDLTSEFRIREAIKYSVEEIQKSGHSWMKKREVVMQTKTLLGLSAQLIAEQLNETIEDIKIIDDRITLDKTYNAEQDIAEKLVDMLNASTELDFDVDKFIEEYEKNNGFEFSDEQKSFFYNFKKYNVNLLVGSAGSGKTSIQKALLVLSQKLNLSTVLMAPTGKAAKVLEKATGRKASTMHSTLEIGYEEQNARQLYDDLLIIDEFSMTDCYIGAKLTNAIKNKYARIVIIGDSFQIPSVGVGNLLHDLIKSDVFPKTELTKIFRQGEGGILDIVTKIRLGQRFIHDDFVGKKMFGNNFLLVSLPSEQLQGAYTHYFKKSLESYPVEDILTLSPKKAGALGVYAANKNLQEIANPEHYSKKEVQYGESTIYRVGDQVINLRNYKTTDIYEREIKLVNGDVGEIVDINQADRKLTIEYDSATVFLSFDDLDSILHSLALTFHKSQGSGYPVAIVIADKSHKFQLNANLLYTALTRASEAGFLLCQADVINSCMKKNVNLQRNTFLQELLHQRMERDKKNVQENATHS